MWAFRGIALERRLPARTGDWFHRSRLALEPLVASRGTLMPHEERPAAVLEALLPFLDG